MTEYGTYKRIYGDRYEAIIQLDPYNSRARLLEYQGEPNKIIEIMKQICREHDFGKLICMVHPNDHRAFHENGLVLEGTIDGFFQGESAGCFSYFFDQERARSAFLSEEDEIISYCSKYKQQGGLLEEPEQLRTAQKKDAEKISCLFKEVFPNYPTPMDQPGYVKKVMDENVLFKIIEIDGNFVSVASADMNRTLFHAEITDCATRVSFRGNGYLNKLVFALERDLKASGFLTSFSLARARSLGMNLVLTKRGYDYSGRHINNCRIMNGFEDMNIWVKRLQT